MSERDELIECLRVCGACHGCGIGADGDTCTNCGDERQLNRLAASLLERDGAELARLRAEVKAQQKSCDEWRGRASDIAHENANLRSEVARLKTERTRATATLRAALARAEAAERDAARYRWLRNESLHRLIRGPICIDADTWGEPVMACGKHITLDGATLDAAIDAAMEGGK